MSNEEEIKKLISQYAQTVHTQDKESFYKLWSKRSDCVLISLTDEFIGIDSIYNDFIIGVLQKAYTNIVLIPESVEVRLINDNVATVVFRYHTECIKRDDGKPYGIKGL